PRLGLRGLASGIPSSALLARAFTLSHAPNSTIAWKFVPVSVDREKPGYTRISYQDAALHVARISADTTGGRISSQSCLTQYTAQPGASTEGASKPSQGEFRNGSGINAQRRFGSESDRLRHAAPHHDFDASCGPHQRRLPGLHQDAGRYFPTPQCPQNLRLP